MTTRSPKNSPARKRDWLSAEERTRRILDAARTLFLEKGYAETSLNDIIRMSGGSKGTIIEQFNNKAGLFAAVIESVADRVASRLTALTSHDTGRPAEVLQRIGEVVLGFYLEPASLIAYRVISAGPSHPDVARAFHLRGHEHIVAPIAQQLKGWHEQGLLLAIDYHRHRHASGRT